MEMIYLHRLHLFAALAAFSITCMLAGCANTKPTTALTPVSVPFVGAVSDRPGSTFGAGK